jgi:hypothetical protein
MLRSSIVGVPVLGIALAACGCSGDPSTAVHSSSGNDTQAAGLVATPFGLVSPACVAEVNANVVVMVGDLPPCPTPLISGENSNGLGGAPPSTPPSSDAGSEDGSSAPPEGDGGGSAPEDGGGATEDDGGAAEGDAEVDGATLTGQNLPSAPGTISGWVEYADWRGNETPGELSATWQVPDVPASNVGQTIFFFPSYESSNGNAIIQTVLQYGVSAAGGGSFWSISSWWVGSSGTARYSNLLPVNSGDTIQGTITASNCNGDGGCTFDIVALDQTLGQSRELVVSDTTSFTWVQAGVLEVYKVSDCSQLPDNPVTFTSLLLNDQNGSPLNVNWQPEYRVPMRNCNYQVGVDSGSVTLGY